MTTQSSAEGSGVSSPRPPERDRTGAGGPSSARRAALYYLISMLIGVGVVFLIGLANPRAHTPANFLGGAFIGFMINLTISLTERTMLVLARPLGARAQFPARLLSYFLGGAGGWYLSVFLIALTTGNDFWSFSLGFAPGLIFFGLFSLGIGLVFYTVERLRSRLEESIAQLKEREFAEKELELARTIQRRLLPPAEIEGEGYRLAARNLPARYVAGDFYDVFRVGAGELGLVVGDVAGKGIGASLIMASVKAMLPLVAAERSVRATLAELNRRLLPDLSRREFVALCYARFDPRSGRLELANAGLPTPYRLAPRCRPSPLEAGGSHLPLGLRRDVRYESLETELLPGERLLVFTDGLAEAPLADDGEPYGYDRFESLLEGEDPSPAATLDRLLESLRRSTLPVQEDDWTALLLESARELDPAMAV